MPIDPDAPWLVNALLTVLILAGIPALTLRIGGRKQRAESSETRALAQQAADSAAVAEHEVRPNSGKSMADVLNRVAVELNAQGERLEALREATGRVERTQADTARDVGGLRSEIRQEREERGDLSRRVTVTEQQHQQVMHRIHDLEADTNDH